MVHKTQLPATSQLHAHIASGDFLDCYATRSALSPREASQRLFEFPGWVSALMALRNTLVAPLGLQTSVSSEADTIGMFPVESETSQEIIAGFNDRHLDFRVAVLSEAGLIHLATWVHPHNLGGHAYLAAVMPFHIVIIRNALGRLAGT